MLASTRSGPSCWRQRPCQYFLPVPYNAIADEGGRQPAQSHESMSCKWLTRSQSLSTHRCGSTRRTSSAIRADRRRAPVRRRLRHRHARSPSVERLQSFHQRDRAPSEKITLGYEAYQASDRDRILWLSFMSSVETESGVGWHVGYALSRPAPDALVGVAEQNWWWAERLTLEAWFAEVEANPVFRECLALDRWTWEGFSD